MLGVALFGAGGEFSIRAVAAISQRHRVLAVVQPAPRRYGIAGTLIGPFRDVARSVLRRRGDLEQAASDLGVPYMRMNGRLDASVATRLRRLNPDIVVIASYPWVLPREVYSVARLGAVNVHSSLLPRHRGPMPLYWLYLKDDRETGVTVHWVTNEPDGGDIILQASRALPRGENIVRVHAEDAEKGAALLTQALDAIEAGTDRRFSQDPRLATLAPSVRPGGRLIDFERWDVERVWHVLAGLFPLFREPLADLSGSAVCYTGVLGFERQVHAERLGSVAPVAGRYELYCRGGVVHLDVASKPA